MSNAANTSSINSVGPLLDDVQRYQGRYSPTRGCWVPFVPAQEEASTDAKASKDSEEAIQGFVSAWHGQADQTDLISHSSGVHQLAQQRQRLGRSHRHGRTQ